MIRTNVYKLYKHLKKERNKKLLKQQVFLSSYIKDNYKSIDKMLLFHGIGTGKTYTSITIAETIKSINPNMKILVILPARLKTNFIDELKGINNYEIFNLDKSKVNELSTDELKFNLIKKLDEIKNVILKIDYVLIENQPTFKNPKMKGLSDTLYTWFMIRGIKDKLINNSLVSKIMFISENILRLKQSKIPSMSIPLPLPAGEQYWQHFDRALY